LLNAWQIHEFHPDGLRDIQETDNEQDEVGKRKAGGKSRRVKSSRV
jgi:hypothetical protein